MNVIQRMYNFIELAPIHRTLMSALRVFCITKLMHIVVLQNFTCIGSNDELVFIVLKYVNLRRIKIGYMDYRFEFLYFPHFFLSMMFNRYTLDYKMSRLKFINFSWQFIIPSRDNQYISI